METSVLLDKLLRAGALRPEDYLVLSRMERMIMANHAAGGNSSLNQSGTRVRQPKSSSDRQQQQQQQQQQIISPAESGTDMRREFEFGPKQSAGLAVSGQLASNENLYDTASPALVVQQHQYQRRLSAGNNGLDVSAGQQMRMQQPIQQQPALARPFVAVRLLQQQFGQLLEQRGDGPGLVAGQQQRQRRSFIISATTATTTATTATAWSLDGRVRRH
jgi:hypothetical protein